MTTDPAAFDPAPTPLGVCRWLAAMDDPSDEVGMAERQTVTLTKIIDEARAYGQRQTLLLPIDQLRLIPEVGR